MVYGYVCACVDSDTWGQTPLIFNIVLEIPFKFSLDAHCAKAADGKGGLLVFSRGIDWGSLGRFSETASPWNSFRHGEPACGIVECANPNEAPPSAILAGWTFDAFRE